MNKIVFKLIPILLFAVIGLAACNRDATGAIAKSDHARVLEPEASWDTLQMLAEDNNHFAIDLYHTLQDEDGNLLFSPYSISLALVMTYGGARGETEAQMAEVLHFELPQAELHAVFNQLDLELAKASEADEEGNQPVQLDIANAIWAQQDYAFLPEYLDLLALNYGAGIHMSDFKTQADETAEEINLWVSDQTHERIQNIISPDILGDLTRLILVNAIYFNAGWNMPFDPENTQPELFSLLDGSQRQVDMMFRTLDARYYAGLLSSGIGYQAIRLPYAGGTVAMDIIVPDTGQFAAFEAALDWNTVEAILGGMHRVDVRLKMPKFTFRSSFSLANPLKAMGMLDAFTADAADFSGMDGTRNLNIDSVIHQAFVAVEEKGTEASAATVVEVVEVSAPIGEPEIIELTIDRPFIFLIRDLSSGQILFVGRVLDPTQ